MHVQSGNSWKIKAASLGTYKSGFGSILARQWFRRRCVIQEVQQAPFDSTYILLGDIVCHKSDFLTVSERFNADSRPIAVREMDGGGPCALFYYDKGECSDPRDYIYASLSEFAPGDRARLEVDYDQDVRFTYLNLVKRTALGIGAEIDEILATRKTIVPCSEGYHYQTLIEYLVVASCKKSTGSQSSLEGWVPDWRLKSRFETNAHKAAVESIMARASAGDWDLVTDVKLHIRNNGHHYLGLRGVLLNPYYFLHATPPDTRRIETTGLRQWVNMAIHAYCVDRELQFQASDRIWLTGFTSSGQWGPEILAFLLREHTSIPLVHETTVYTLHSCCLLDGWSGHEMRAALSYVQAASPGVKQDLATHGLLLDVEFDLG